MAFSDPLLENYSTKHHMVLVQGTTRHWGANRSASKSTMKIWEQEVRDLLGAAEFLRRGHFLLSPTWEEKQR